MRATKRERLPSAFILTALAVIGSMGGAAGAALKETPEAGFVWKDGAEVYAKVCALCHEAKVGPTILRRGLDPNYIRFIVRHGNRAMPAFRAAEIDDESLAKVAEYVSKK
ncbi:MAG TPA: cytochrome c [Nitrospira sp.]|nr:cytochrome c [Nitrospira sp.]